MRNTLLLLLTLMLVIIACEKPEEILPVPPQPENPPRKAPVEIFEEIKPSFSADSGFYQYGKYERMPYRILIPRNYDPAKNYPLHIFLHGIGERGSDNEKQLTLGASHFQADSIREKYPSFIIFPQCPATEYWFNDLVMQTLRGLIEAVQTEYFIDKDKISIGGFSMGAYGTFAMVAAYPELFEAAVAISGDGDTDKASQMSKPRWQVFAGERDNVVPSNKTQRMAIALRKAGASVSFTLFPEADHGGTWANAFSDPDFFYRLFAPLSEPGLMD